jgi:DNA-binding protein H-NS
MSNFEFLNEYNTKQLSEMIPVIQKLMKKKKKAEKDSLRQKMALLAAENGFTIDEILGKGKTTVKRTIKAKYKNPASDQTWSGRGRKPKWVVELVENGGDIETCTI